MAATATAPESGAEAAGGRAGAGRGRLARRGAVRRRRGGAGFSQAPRGRVALSASGWWRRRRRACQGLGVRRCARGSPGSALPSLQGRRLHGGKAGRRAGRWAGRRGRGVRASARRTGGPGAPRDFFSVWRLLRWGRRDRRPAGRERVRGAGRPPPRGDGSLAPTDFASRPVRIWTPRLRGRTKLGSPSGRTQRRGGMEVSEFGQLASRTQSPPAAAAPAPRARPLGHARPHAHPSAYKRPSAAGPGCARRPCLAERRAWSRRDVAANPGSATF